MSLDSELLAAGTNYHRAGEYQQAHEVYRRLLEANPQNAMIFNLLGAVSINLRQWPQAAAYLEEALRLNPSYSAVHDNLGVLLTTQNRFAEAIASYRRAVTLDPRNAQTWLNLANALVRNGQKADAIEAFRQVAQWSPDHVQAHSELAKLLFEHGRLVESIPHFRQVARLQPDDPKAHFELADALAQGGQVDESIAAYQNTLQLKPDSAEACVNLAYLHIQKKSFDEAVRWARRAIELRPRFAEAHLNLGCALTKQEKFAEAIIALQEAAALKPQMPESLNNLGIALAEDGQITAAVDTYRKSLAIRSENPDALYNLGIALLKRGDPQAALEHFDRAIELRPEYAEAHHNRSATLLLTGDFSKGFAEYEWRFRSRDFPPYQPRWRAWDGTALQGRTIVMCAEQGLGDTIQFVRYAPLIQALGARVLVECSSALHSVLARTENVDGWISAASPTSHADCCVPMLSVPYRLQTTLETIPAKIPYVFADPQLVAAWQPRLAAADGLKVGIVWQGNPDCPGDRSRSIPLARFAPLARVPGVRLVNLQKGAGLEQLREFAEPWSVIDFGDAVDQSAGAFMDTAAIMKNLDLVITSDTAAAHLAGALGVNVWLALQMVPDWRWMLQREDSPWYSTMRLFRQTQLGDWPEVFERIACELERLVGHCSAG